MSVQKSFAHTGVFVRYAVCVHDFGELVGDYKTGYNRMQAVRYALEQDGDVLVGKFMTACKMGDYLRNFVSGNGVVRIRQAVHFVVKQAGAFACAADAADFRMGDVFKFICRIDDFVGFVCHLSDFCFSWQKIGAVFGVK